MPCDGDVEVEIFLRDNVVSCTRKAKNCYWDTNLASSVQIIGWRYADKPAWKLPDPPAGRQWHRTDWTEEMLQEGWRPLLLGEKLQTQTDEMSPKVPTNWETIYGLVGDSVNELSDYWFFRTRRPLPTEPVMVPLVQSDVDITHKFRYAAHQGDDWLPPIGVDCTGVTFGSESRGIFRVPFDELKDSWQIKRPGQDWQPCSKPSAQ
jgi:hypothetical protein